MILLELFLTFFKIGAFTFGGGYAMLPMIQQEVLVHGWLSMEELVDFIAISESTPGPFAINAATYIGVRTAGLVGATCATLGVICPSFMIILLIVRAYQRFQKSPYVIGVLAGLKPAVVGLIAAAVLSVSKEVFFPKGMETSVLSSVPFYVSLGILLLMSYLRLGRKVTPIYLIGLSLVLGLLSGMLGVIG